MDDEVGLGDALSDGGFGSDSESDTRAKTKPSEASPNTVEVVMSDVWPQAL